MNPYFKPMLRPTQAPIPDQAPPLLDVFVKDSFTLPTLLALGAFFQTLVIALLPAPYALLPLAFFLGRALISTTLQVRTLRSHPLPPQVIPGRVTAQLPVPQDDGAPGSARAPRPPLAASLGGAAAAAAPLVTFHLGIRFHHPLGLLSPGAREVGAHFRAMRDALAARRDEFGVVSTSLWRGTPEDRSGGGGGAPALLLVAYFRAAAGLSAFAHDPVHRRGWDWYRRLAREGEGEGEGEGGGGGRRRHFGLFHETFVSRPGEWETIYLDCQPTLLGRGNVRVRAGAGPGAGEGKEGGEEGGGEQEVWIRPLVSADHPALRSQAKRMGMTPGIHEDLERNNF